MKLYNVIELFVKSNGGKKVKVKRYAKTETSTDYIDTWFGEMFYAYTHSKIGKTKATFNKNDDLEIKLKEYFIIIEGFFNSITFKKNKYVLKIDNWHDSLKELSDYFNTNYQFNEGDIVILETPEFDFFGDLDENLTAFEAGMFDAFWYLKYFTHWLVAEEEVVTYKEIVKFLESQKSKFKFISNENLVENYCNKFKWGIVSDEVIKKAARNPLHLKLINYFDGFVYNASSKNFAFYKHPSIGYLTPIYNLYLSKFTKDELDNNPKNPGYSHKLEVIANKRVWSEYKDEIINKFIELYLK